MMTSLDISASGLSAQRVRMNLIANNLANVNTTRDEFGQVNPFRKSLAIFRAGGSGPDGKYGVNVPYTVLDDKAPRKEYNPGHPDADASGYVLMPNVNVIEEMVDMIAATRAYEANISAMDSAKSMMSTSLRILA